jgi:hypothetical protein
MAFVYGACGILFLAMGLVLLLNLGGARARTVGAAQTFMRTDNQARVVGVAFVVIGLFGLVAATT